MKCTTHRIIKVLPEPKSNTIFNITASNIIKGIFYASKDSPKGVLIEERYYAPPITISSHEDIITIENENTIHIYYFYNEEYYCIKYGERYRELFTQAIKFIKSDFHKLLDLDNFNMDDYIRSFMTWNTLLTK
jgi:hypothetical protein